MGAESLRYAFLCVLVCLPIGALLYFLSGRRMREDLESKGPVRLSEVETQQKQILQIVRRLADEGQIVLGGKGEDSFV